MRQPPGARWDDLREYVLEAVKVWRGQLRPPGGYRDDDKGDIMWALDPETVEVKRYRVKKKQTKV